MTRPLSEEARIKKLRSFGLIMAGFLALVALSCWRHARALPWPVSLGAAAAFLAAALTAPSGLAPLEEKWMALARVLGRINAAIILTLLYYVLISPIAWLMRRFGGDPLELDYEGESYWRPIKTGEDLSRYEKQF